MSLLPLRRLITSYDTDDQLLIAIIRQDLSTVRYILQSPRYRSLINQSLYFRAHQNELNHPMTLLASACHYGSYATVDLLINDYHANVNKQDLPGWQAPLHHAVVAKSNRLEIVQFLLRHGAHVDAQDRHGTTALMLAVLHSYDDIVHLLLEQAGANVRIYNQYHFTALDFVKSNVSMISHLIRSGAFVFERNSNHTKLFQWLIVNKHRRLARLLIEAGYSPGKPFLSSRIRSLKSLCRLEIRERISGSHFRQQIASLPVRNRQLIKYILLDDV